MDFMTFMNILLIARDLSDASNITRRSIPPSTVKLEPVEYVDASEAKYRINPIISEGCINLFAGDNLENLSTNSGS